MTKRPVRVLGSPAPLHVPARPTPGGNTFASRPTNEPLPPPPPPSQSPSHHAHSQQQRLPNSCSSDNDDGHLTPDSQHSELIGALTMADPFSALTQGSLLQISQNADVVNPIVQCVQIKPMASQNGAERFRVVMSDSVNFMQGMLAQQMNSVIHDNKLKKGSICRLKQFQPNFVKDKHILIVLDLDVLDEYGEPEKLGQPVAIETKQEGQPQEETKPQPGNIGGGGFYGSKPQPAPQQQQQQSNVPVRNSNAASRGGSHANIYPIEALSPYAHKWTIKARCTHKSDIKTWKNAKGEGKLFSVNFLDDSGEIRATGFNDAVDSWYDILQEGSVYYVSNPCKVQLAKKQFSNLNNDYELTFERDTVLEKAEDAEGVPQVQYNFTSIADLQNIEKDGTIDCIGILQDVGDVSEIVSKTSGKPFTKREINLVDTTGYTVRLTIWGKVAETFDTPPGAALAFKGVKVSDFNGRSLSLLSSGTMNVDPDIDDAFKLKGWWDGSGRHETFASHAGLATSAATSGGERNATKTIAQIKDENLGMSDDADWFSLKATLIYVKQDSFAYPACRSDACNKKVVEPNPGEGAWRCEKCDKTWDAPEYRYIMSVNVSDHTGQMWLSCFNETGMQVMGMSADELVVLRDEGDERKVAEAFHEANCRTWVFRCKAKMDTFQDQQRVRYQVQYAKPVDFAAEAKKLADIIKQYEIADNSSNAMFVT